MKKNMIFVLSISIFLTASAMGKPLNSLVGKFTRSGETRLCRDISIINIELSSDSNLKIKTDVEKYNRIYKGINKGAFKIPAAMFPGAAALRRLVFDGEFLKVQEKHYLFTPIYKRFEDKQTLLEVLDHDTLIYYFGGYWNSRCEFTRVYYE